MGYSSWFVKGIQRIAVDIFLLHVAGSNAPDSSTAYYYWKSGNDERDRFTAVFKLLTALIYCVGDCRTVMGVLLSFSVSSYTVVLTTDVPPAGQEQATGAAINSRQRLRTHSKPGGGTGTVRRFRM